MSSFPRLPLFYLHIPSHTIKVAKGWIQMNIGVQYWMPGVAYPDRLSEEGKGEVDERLNELVDEFGEGGVL